MRTRTHLRMINKKGELRQSSYSIYNNSSSMIGIATGTATGTAGPDFFALDPSSSESAFWWIMIMMMMEMRIVVMVMVMDIILVVVMEMAGIMHWRMQMLRHP